MPVETEREIELQIEGMTCSACASRIEKVLNKMEGVRANVNLTAEKAYVRFDPGSASVLQLIERIRKAGYDAHPSADAAAEKERRRQAYRTLRSQFIAAAVLTFPLVVQMFLMLFGIQRELPAILQLLLATPVQFWIGWRFYAGAYHSVRGGGANMDVLVALGTTMAFLFSAAVVLFGLHQHLYFEASATIVTLVFLGKLLEARAREKTTGAIERLLKLQPKTVHLIRDGGIEDTDLLRVEKGESFLVKAGEVVPVDGEVYDGKSTLDESMLTGESMPVGKETGSRIFAGTLNLNGLLKARITGVGPETALAGIIRMVERAQGSKAPIQRLADTVSGYFVPAVMAASLITFFSWWLIAGDFSIALVNSVAVMVIACPCALGLATPTAIMVGSGQGALAGILIRNAAALEQAGKIGVLVLDKTGTLTEGKPLVVDEVPGRLPEDPSLLQLAVTLEQGSIHPLARAILERGREKGVLPLEMSGFTDRPGKGVAAIIRNERVMLGSPRLMEEEGMAWNGNLWKRATELQQEGKTVIVASRGREVAGLFGIMDPLKTNSKRAIEAMQNLNLRIIMLTGDHPAAAGAIAGLAGIKEFRSEVTPDGKAREVLEIRKEGRLTGMVGDGINDAPALASADVSFAMGAGSDAALESADVTLMRNDLMSVVDAIRLSRLTIAKIRQNLFFAFIYNILGIPMAAAGMLNPVIAGAAMALSSVTVVTNSLLLRRWQPGSA